MSAGRWNVSDMFHMFVSVVCFFYKKKYQSRAYAMSLRWVECTILMEEVCCPYFIGANKMFYMLVTYFLKFEFIQATETQN